MTSQRNQRATGHTEVTRVSPSIIDEVPNGPALADVQLTETFSGDIEGEGIVRFIQASRNDGTSTFVGIERVRGAIAGRNGTFLLEIGGTAVGNELRAEWSVVPGSGTEELTGLRGAGGFEAQRGQHGSVWLDYSFE